MVEPGKDLRLDRVLFIPSFHMAAPELVEGPVEGCRRAALHLQLHQMQLQHPQQIPYLHQKALRI